MLLSNVMGIVFIVYTIINAILIKKSGGFNKSREFVKIMFLIYFFGVLVYTINFGYLGSGFGNVNYIPFVETLKMFNGEGTSMALHQVVGNLIMLAPLAMFLATLYKKCNNILKIAGITFMCSLIIEVNQFFTGRIADVDDLIINTLGGVLGYLVYKLLVNIVKKIKLFRVILDNSANDKSAVKGILVVIIPTFIIIQGGYHLENYLHIKNNSVDMSNINSVFEERGRKVITTKNIEKTIICMTKDNEGDIIQLSTIRKESIILGLWSLR
ncbi:MAG: VanZ family protein [Sarcina sp.]